MGLGLLLVVPRKQGVQPRDDFLEHLSFVVPPHPAIGQVIRALVLLRSAPNPGCSQLDKAIPRAQELSSDSHRQVLAEG